MTAPIRIPTPSVIEEAVRKLRDGALIGMPTETVYGLAADAANGEAVSRIYDAKGRPHFNPLIGHVASFEMAEAQGEFSANARRLAEAFWPGPLTLVVPFKPSGTISDLARAGLDTIALRRPAHPVAQALLDAFGTPLVAPSANPSGKISPTRAADVAADLGDKLDMILDGGACSAGLESTIIDATGETAVLLRPGALDPALIETIWPGLVRPSGEVKKVRSPGQLLRHYAPKNSIRLNVTRPDAGEVFLGFGALDGMRNLSKNADLVEAAKNLFSYLRELDKLNRPIAVAPIPKTGLGEAINDRLTRAANSG